MIRQLPARVWLLALIQALAMSAGATVVLAGGIVGAQLAPYPSLATLPVAMMIVGTACGVLPVTQLMRRFGRKKGFTGSAVVAAAAAMAAGLATYIGNFGLFLAAIFMLGLCIAGFQQIRFAAIEAVPFDLAPRAMSTVLLGGLVAAVLGPELVTLGQAMFSQAYVGSFLLVSAASLLCALLFQLTAEQPLEQVSNAEPARGRWQIIRQPYFIIAVSTSVIGFALMSFIMTATPVHMHVHQSFSLEQTKWVIQSHIIAMYLPSFFSAWLINRLGIKGVIFCGLSIYIATMLIGFYGAEWASYWVALVLLGLGWNLLFLAGTVLLGKSHSPNEKFAAQGMHDFMVFSAQAFAALGAGAILALTGWSMLMIISAALIGLHTLILLSQSLRLRRNSV
ncbi:MFS transporter [Alteromonas sp. ASW11-36]|uniref:MFS transporter n=1 Tax=Alteromonas arenosi TaxID=3055817 RepID=A0ABT7SZ53_9ALTE|nr:MFS transporter [Alteromonas sp. ASW11-36]MDM7861474.1 MFS transporter [Alteromonas sp. ASW11-36]